MAATAGLTHVVSETSPDNIASQRGLQKGGMTKLGEARFTVMLNVIVVRTVRPSKHVARVSLCI